MFSFNDDDYVTEYRPRKHGGPSNTVLILLIVLVLLVFAVSVTAIVYLLKSPAGPTPSPSETTDPPQSTTENPSQTTTAPVTEPQQPQVGLSFYGTPIDTVEIYRGDLILVNSNYPYNFTANAEKDSKVTDLYNIWKPYPNYCYKLTGTKVKTLPFLGNYLNTFFDAFLTDTGKKDYLVTSCFRTYEIQEETLKEMIEKYGSEETALRYTAKPGYSEHHTGLAMDVYVFTDDQITYKLGEAKMPDVYNWIYENAPKYGFIQRYKAAKESITGYAEESWHFRYVGTPHAEIIEENGFCLEEYIDFLRGYSYPNYLSYEAANGKSYLIYYEPVKTETVVIPEVRDENGNLITPVSTAEQFPGKSTLHLPNNASYTVSGNNVDGFIVTITLD